MNKKEFASKYQAIQEGIIRLEKERTALLANYREALGLSAKERLDLVVQLWPNIQEIILVTGLSEVTIRATVSHLGLSRLSKPNPDTLRHRISLRSQIS